MIIEKNPIDFASVVSVVISNEKVQCFLFVFFVVVLNEHLVYFFRFFPSYVPLRVRFNYIT